MTDNQKRLVQEFGEIAKQKKYCETIVFMVGTIAFSKDAVESSSSDAIMKKMIEIANKSKTEADFFKSVTKEFVYTSK
ncbi:MAG: hypothetical protein ACI4MZ_01320 [Christensenellales bacterium]